MLSICFSTREDNPKYIAEIKKSLKLKDVEIIQEINPNKKSLTKLYNEFLKKAKYDNIVLMHDDLILEKGWDKKMYNYLNNSDYGIIGIAGTTNFHESCMWWKHNLNMVGQVWHKATLKSGKSKTWLSAYSGKFKNTILDTIIVDGLMMGVNRTRLSKKKPFDEKVEGFHFYDISFCLSEYFKKTKIGVVTDLGKIIHLSVGKITNDDGTIKESWESGRAYVAEKHKKNLPIQIEPSLVYQDKVFDIPKRKNVSVIINYKQKRKFVDCLSSIITNSENYLDKLDFIVTHDEKQKEEVDSIVKMFNGTFNNINIETIDFPYYNYAKNNLEAAKKSKNEILIYVDDHIVFNNDIISFFQKYMHKHKDVGTISPRIHNEDKTVFYLGGIYTVQIRKDEEGNERNILLLGHESLNTSYKYSINAVTSVGGVCEKVFMTTKDFIIKNKFNENILRYYYGFDIGIKVVKENKKNTVIQDAVATYMNADIEDDNELINKDYKETIVPLVTSNFEKLKPFMRIEKG